MNWEQIKSGNHFSYETTVWGMKVTVDRGVNSKYPLSWYWELTRKDGTKVDISPYPGHAFGIGLPSTYQGPYHFLDDAMRDVNRWFKQFEEAEEPL